MLNNIPEELKALPQWVCYKIVGLPGKSKPDKIPFSCDGSSSGADEGHRKTWATFEQCLEVFNKGVDVETTVLFKDRMYHQKSPFDGIGFVFTKKDPYIGIDWDNVGENIDKTLKQLNTYTEISQSGNGFHAIAKMPKGLPTNCDWNRITSPFPVEMYTHNRYFVFTGNIYKNFDTIYDRTEEIFKYRNELKPTTLNMKFDVQNHYNFTSEEELLNMIRQSKNADKFHDLFTVGDIIQFGNDHSRADLALCSILAFWTGGDAKTIDSLFRKSKLYRSKWDERHGKDTYGNITIDKALSAQTEFYGKNRQIVKECAGTNLPPIINKETINQIETFVKLFEYLELKFRMNLLGDNIEFCKEGVWQNFNDKDSEILKAQARELGIANMPNLYSNIVLEASKHSYNPITTFIESESWDGKTDHIGRLASYFTVDSNSALIFNVVLEKFLIGAVARIYEETDNPMLILAGKQNVGKSYFAKWLTGPLSAYFYDGTIDVDNKDHKIKLKQTWIWEPGEFGATIRKSDRDALKQFLTISSVKERAPYGHFETKGQAITSFIGTFNPLNDQGFLSDPTGERRYNPISVLGINFDYTKTIKPAEIWAQAYTLYKAGRTHRLSLEEKVLIDKVRNFYTTPTPIDDYMDENFEVDVTKVDDLGWRVHTRAIKDVIMQKSRAIPNLNNEHKLSSWIGEYLQRKGLVSMKSLRISGKISTGYCGIRFRNENNYYEE